MSFGDLLAESTIATLSATALLGLLVGSFLNVVAHRLPRMLERDWRRQCEELFGEAAAGGEADEEPLNLLRPPSHCPHCGHRIGPLENIPLISYLFLRGRCSACRTRISLRYPLVEALTGILSVAVIAQLGPTWQGAAALGLTWALIALTLIDIDHQILPDVVTLPLLWIGLLLSLAGLFTGPEAAILGAAAGYLSLWVVYQAFRLLTGKEGMGYGDFKLLAAFGAWLGWQYLPLVLLLSALVGSLVGIAMIVALARDRRLPIPFGPYLAGAGWIALLWGDQINGAYLRWAGLA
ncbi:MAG: A24 family peptidase [Chromatiales bacterium]|jgi:leader peptidase (prepilin peptidase)/N-methyltransferase